MNVLSCPDMVTHLVLAPNVGAHARLYFVHVYCLLSSTHPPFISTDEREDWEELLLFSNKSRHLVYAITRMIWFLHDGIFMVM